MQDRNFANGGGVRGRACLLAVLAALCGCALSAPAAVAANVEGGNAFSELSRKAQEEEATTSKASKSTTSSETEVHNSNTIIFIGIGAAIVLLLAIAAVIVRDARRVAPAGAEELGEGRSGRDGAARRRNARAKARAARAQRKKNR